MTEDADDRARDTSVRADLVRGGIWTVLAAVVGVPLSIVSNIVLARSLGVADLGAYGQIVVVWFIGAMVVNSGVSAASVQWLASSRGRGDRPTYLRVVRVCGAYHLLLQAPVLGLLAIVLTRQGPAWVVVIAATACLVEQVLGTASVVMSGAGRNAMAARIGIVGAVVRFILTVGAAVSTNDPVIIWGVSTVTGVLTGLLQWRGITSEERSQVVAVRGARPWPAGFRRFAVNVGVITVCSNLVFGRSELLVLGWFSQDVAAGLFVIAAAIAALVTIPLDAMMGPLAPAASYFTGRSAAAAADVLERAVRISGVLAGALAAAAPVAVAAAVPIMYGDGFAGAVVAAQALTCVSLVQSVLNPMSSFSLATGRSGLVLGLTGAVVASVAGQLVHLLGGAELAARLTSTSRRRLGTRCAPLAVGVAIGLLLAGVTRLGPTTGPAGLAVAVAAAVLGLLMYRLCLHLVPAARIPQADWDSMFGVLGPRTARLASGARTLIGERIGA